MIKTGFNNFISDCFAEDDIPLEQVTILPTDPDCREDEDRFRPNRFELTVRIIF